MAIDAKTYQAYIKKKLARLREYGNPFAEAVERRAWFSSTPPDEVERLRKEAMKPGSLLEYKPPTYDTYSIPSAPVNIPDYLTYPPTYTAFGQFELTPESIEELRTEIAINEEITTPYTSTKEALDDMRKELASISKDV